MMPTDVISGILGTQSSGLKLPREKENIFRTAKKLSRGILRLKGRIWSFRSRINLVLEV